MEAGLKRQLIELELYLLKAEVRASVAELGQLIHDEFIEFGASGQRFGKQVVLSRLPQESCPKFHTSDFEVRMLAEGVAQLLYRAKMHKPNEFAPRYSLRSSIWKLNAGQWQMAFHQGTVCEAFD
ncbi:MULTISPECIES: DUF4440 domain-containing protein [Shewanella]|uniref:nuclear transport factor 2 family protein n=1 Tax=Shewanella TaxID=22 RepID=UPI00048B86FA|nr:MULTISPECIES: DUF4440 domain-containing protein [Shewanella]QLE87472.1 DUF4440 domain-containing protein [Shewanella sp. Scap07]